MEDLIANLSEESDQDEVVSEGKSSYLAGINAENLVRREMEYSDPEKQWIRRQWLKTGEALYAKLNRPLRYLTLPAYYRFDVTMMLKKGLLGIVGQNGRDVLSVAAFEADPGKFALMTGASPDFELFGNCTLEDAMTNSKSAYFADLLAMFPFDIVNFDLTTSLTPQHEGPYSRVMQALDEVMKRQAPRTEEWALFLTFRNVEAEWETTALKQFIDNLQENIDTWPAVRDKFVQTLNVNTAQELKEKDSAVAIVQSVGKWLVDRAHFHGHSCTSIESFFYNRYPDGLENYKISKLLMTFKRGTRTASRVPMKEPVREVWMETDLVNCISRNKHKDVEYMLLSGNSLDDLIEQIAELKADFETTYTRAQPVTPDAAP